MDRVFLLTTKEIAHYLSRRLPSLGQDWWQKNVLDRLSFQQQRIAQEKGVNKLDDLDFAALLRIFDQNWFDLSGDGALPREARNWIKELQVTLEVQVVSEEAAPPWVALEVHRLGLTHCGVP